MHNVLLNKRKRALSFTLMVVAAACLAWFGLVSPVVAKSGAYFSTNDTPTRIICGNRCAQLTVVAQGLPAISTPVSGDGAQLDDSDQGGVSSESEEPAQKTYVLVSVASVVVNTDLPTTFSFVKDIHEQQENGVENPHATLRVADDVLIDVYPYENSYDNSTDYYFTLDSEQAIELDIALDAPSNNDEDQSIYVAVAQASTLDEAARDVANIEDVARSEGITASAMPQVGESVLAYTWTGTSDANGGVPAKAPKKAPAKLDDQTPESDESDPEIVKGAPGSFTSTNTGMADNFAALTNAYMQFREKYLIEFFNQMPGNITDDRVFTRDGANAAMNLLYSYSGGFQLPEEEEIDEYRYDIADIADIANADPLYLCKDLREPVFFYVYDAAETLGYASEVEKLYEGKNAEAFMNSSAWQKIKVYLVEHIIDDFNESGVTDSPVSELLWPNGNVFDVEEFLQDWVQAYRDVLYFSRNHITTSEPYAGVEFDLIMYDTYDAREISSAQVKKQIPLVTGEDGSVRIPLSSFVDDSDFDYSYTPIDYRDNPYLGVVMVIKERIPEGLRIPQENPRWYTIIYRPDIYQRFAFHPYSRLNIFDEDDETTLRVIEHSITDEESDYGVHDALKDIHLFDIPLEIANEPILTDFTLRKIGFRSFLPEFPLFLPSATFSLVGGGYNKTLTTGNDGTLEFTDIPVGTYTLTEVDPPAGFAIEGSGMWQIVVEAVQDSITYDITRTVTITPYTDDTPAALDADWAEVYTNTVFYDEESNSVMGEYESFNVVNDEITTYELPDTGGHGTYAYSAAGAILALLAAVFTVRRLRGGILDR